MEDVADGIDADEHHDDADNAMDEDQADDGPAPSPAVHKAVAGELELALPYVEQYRPMFLRDVVGNEDTIQRLEAIAEEGNMPNLIIAGPPGTGKTTSILCLSRQLLGPAFKDAVLELNASDDRGIDVVRNKIKMFATKKVSLLPGKHKIVILDEADSMTKGAQQALRRTMELFSSTTRFALACNNSTKIIEPIQSRCAILRYTKLSDSQVLKRLLEVCRSEKIPYDDSGLEALIFTAEGDMRNALNNLQSTHAGFGMVSSRNVFKVCDQPHPQKVEAILDACLTERLDDALQGIAELWNFGYSSLDLVSTFFKVIKGMDTLPEALKLEFLQQVSAVHMRVMDGVVSLLQLQGMCGKLTALARESKPGTAK